jgi:staphylococcal nuclease domain-containing protein 1
MWKDYEEAAEVEPAPAEDTTVPLKSEYLDVIVSDVRVNNGFSFSVQILNTEGKSNVCI